MHKTAFPPWPYFTEDEIEATSRVLRSGKVNYLTGKEGHLFEKEFAESVNCEYAIALANCTVALELALYTLDIGPGDEVIVPSRTFLGTASPVVARGAIPIIADVDPLSQNITADTIAAVLTPQTKAIIVVHLAGWACDMDPILALAKKHQLKIIEDCAQAQGARYKDKPVGSLGDIAAFSFCQDKITTSAGEGGMLTTNNYDIWYKGWAYKDHGKDYDTVYHQQHPPGFRWLHQNFGTNWRLSEVQSAVGRIQLSKLPDWVEQRRLNASVLTEAFQTIPALRLTLPEKSFYHAYYKYYAFLKPELLKSEWSREHIIVAINEQGIPCFSGSCSEIYLEGAFKRAKLGPKERLPVAKELGETSLMFLVHPTCNTQHMEHVGTVVKKILTQAMK